jgi:hypothetical protein
VARTVIERVISDLSGKEIADGKAWTMTLTPPDGRRNTVRLDISEDEARRWLSKGTEVKRRGRPLGSSATGRTSAVPANGRRRRKATAAPVNGRRKRKTPTANGRRKTRAKD